MHRAVQPLLASLLAFVAFGAAAAQPSPFGAPLQCAKASSASVLAAMRRPGAPATNDSDMQWVIESMGRISRPAAVPAPAPLRAAAMSVAGLIRRGSVVAAKMANDEAVATVPGYKATEFAKSAEALLTVVTQPVLHASYPSSVRAAGELWPAVAEAHHDHTFGVDMEQSSESLSEIIARAAVSKRALGALYDRPVVRFHMLANGFHDAVALEASSSGVCALRLEPSAVQRVDVSARFMAMPGKFSAPEAVAK